MARYWQLLVKAQGDTKRGQRAMRDLKKASRNLSNAIGVDFRNIARVGAFALGAGLAASVKVGIDELKENARVASQTAAGIKSTGGAANVSAKQIMELGSALQTQSGMSDEVIRSGANMLLTFTKVRNEAGKGNKVFDRATQAALDLSVRGFGSMDSTSKMLGKALNDPIKGISAMSRAGVTFTASQKKSIEAMVESGNILGAQKAILKEVETQVGGSAAAYGKTLPGQISLAKETFGDMAGEILKTVIPSVTSLGLKASELLVRLQAWTKTRAGQDALASLRAGLQQAGKAIGVVASAIGKLIGFLYRWRDVLIPLTAAVLAMFAAWRGYVIIKAAVVAIKALNVAMRANPIGLVITAIVGLIAVLIVLYKRSATFRAIVNAIVEAFKRLGRFALQVFQSIRARMQPVVNLLKLIATLYLRNLVAQFRLVRAAAVAVWNAVSAAWGRAVGLFQQVRNALNFGDAFRSLKDGFKIALNAIIGLWNRLEFKIPALKVAGKEIFGGASIGTPNLPYLAKGGMIRRPGAAIVGEAGPELVELPRGARVTPLGKTSGNTYNVTINAQQPVDTVAFMRSLRVAARMGTV